MGRHGNHNLIASHGPSPVDGALIRVSRLDALRGALMHLAWLVAQSWLLRPDTVSKIAAEHARRPELTG